MIHAHPPIDSAAEEGKPFVHLHVHTEYSLLDGLSKIDKLIKRAQQYNMTSVAITDHGAMFGAINFYRACKAANIKPIIGMESYMAHKDMRRHDQTERQPFHLLLLAKNLAGYRNLLKIASAAQMEGFYSRPRIDKDYLARHADGLICTSGCLAAEIPRLIASNREDEARKTIGWYQDVFGKENFFLELQHHDIPELPAVNKWLIANRDYARAPLLATNDTHYVDHADHSAHDILLCIQTNARINDEKRMRMSDASYHFRSQAEMWDLFGEVPEALYNTHLVAEMCERYNLERDAYHLPLYPVPNGYDTPSYLEYLSQRGLEWRYGPRASEPALRDRLAYELSVIFKMGFGTYFLIVWDICQFARYRDIWMNVRGSAAGSVVAYCLGITNIDPIENNLIFERFLNPGRVSMPDIDLDFPDDRRMEMIEYAMQKYGADKVGAIITFGTLKARAAIKDVGRALGMSPQEVGKLTALVPNVPSKPVTLAECLGDDESKAVPSLKEIYRADAGTRNLLDTAMLVEGLIRNTGTHAAGVVIADKTLVEYIPLHRPIGESKLAQVTQFGMEVCESLGLLKVDFLGLSTLTIMRKACALIEQYHDIRLDPDNIPYRPDPTDREQQARVSALFDLIGKGDTAGVFQLEGGGMRGMLVKMKPRTFEHIVAAIALYRPGPMQFIDTYIKRMHEEEPTTYPHPKLRPILEETYGICVYQEQIQQIAASLFSYSLGDADLMRRAVSKKKAKDLMEHKARFVANGPANDVSVEVAEEIFDMIEYFAAYGFNKSHSADYAVLTCQTAYLKAHYPAEYYTALLSVQRDTLTDVILFIAACRRSGIQVLPPSINASHVDFSIETTPSGARAIRYGLSAVKNAGERDIETLIAGRGQTPFTDLTDFCRRVDLRMVGRRTLEALVKVGAFDSLGERNTLLFNLDRIISAGKKNYEMLAAGQFNIFGQVDALQISLLPLPLQTEPASQREHLKWEKDLIGFYISEHPVQKLQEMLATNDSFVTISAISAEPDDYDRENVAVTIVGIVASIRLITTKKGDEMATIEVEDPTGLLGVVIFPKVWKQVKKLVVVDAVLMIKGKVDRSRGEVQIQADAVLNEFDYGRPADAVTAPAQSHPPIPSKDDTQEVPSVKVQNSAYETDDFSLSLEDISPDQMPRTALLLTVRFTRTESAEEDKNRLNWLKRTLESHPGHDQLRVQFVKNKRIVVVDYPEHTFDYNAEIKAELAKHFSDEDLSVETIVTTPKPS
jgi:DNA polymerase III subunit alpha